MHERCDSRRCSGRHGITLIAFGTGVKSYYEVETVVFELNWRDEDTSSLTVRPQFERAC